MNGGVLVIRDWDFTVDADNSNRIHMLGFNYIEVGDQARGVPSWICAPVTLRSSLVFSRNNHHLASLGF